MAFKVIWRSSQFLVWHILEITLMVPEKPRNKFSAKLQQNQQSATEKIVLQTTLSKRQDTVCPYSQITR